VPVGKWVSLKKKIWKKLIFLHFKSLKKGFGSGGDPDPLMRCGSGSAPKCHGSPTLCLTVQLLIKNISLVLWKYDPGCLSRIRIFFIPNPGVRKALDPFSGSVTLVISNELDHVKVRICKNYPDPDRQALDVYVTVTVM
jgi:hypothetical protein